MKGERIGACTDQFNLRWAVLSAELSDLQRRQALPGQVSTAALANRWVARDGRAPAAAAAGARCAGRGRAH